jgi:hypothetical protein
MPRCISQTDKNKLVIVDNMSGDKIALFYRMPTTQERINYKASLVKIKGNKISKTQATITRMAYGEKIITGFQESKENEAGTLEGGFTCIDPADGKEKPFASDPESPNYRKDWMELIKSTSSDIFDYLAYHVFESIAQSPVEMDDDENPEAAADLGK